MDEILTRLEKLEEQADKNSETIKNIIDVVQSMSNTLNALGEIVNKKIPDMEREMTAIQNRISALR
ncbi:MAG TPA: hypothetical protein ENG70_03705 [Candidatus Cloacimonetes bacterium]|nr:hypothetical protein [Candidatus Cloacimonadota bacterium]HEX37949.1 hypothetical protein [Candidatus Cloacimonadota bacterium]